MPCGGRHMMPVNSTLCRGAGVRAGDHVEVVMERDEEKRTVDAPPLYRRNWQEQSGTGELGQAFVYAQKRNGSVHSWSEAGRNPHSPTRQGNGCSQDRDEVDRLRTFRTRKWGRLPIPGSD